MNSQLIIRLDKEKKERFEQTVRKRGKTVSEVLREFIDDYTQRHDMTGFLGKLMAEMGESFKQKGITPEDIERAIREVREKEHKTKR